MENDIPQAHLAQLSEFVAEALGLHFPSERWPDLQRGVVAAARASGFEGKSSLCGQWILGQTLSRPQIEHLASHLTVGETYFFRDRKQFDFLAQQILPSLVQQRRGYEQRLRIWSAACCTGEEAYSLAILLKSALPDWREWNITLLATDINRYSLRKAEAGIFSQWSFRDTPPSFKSTYFKAHSDGQYEILPEIRKMVQFTQLNLAEDVYPSLVNDTNAMDVIFCRNVLMYFTAQQANKVMEKLYRAQIDGGWLFVSPSELLHVSSSTYATINSHGCILHRKQGGGPLVLKKMETVVASMPVLDSLSSSPMHISFQPESAAPHVSTALSATDDMPFQILAQATALYADGHYDEVIARLQESNTNEAHTPDACSLLVHSLANQGRLVEALVCCDQWVAADKLNASAHYLRATVLQEQGKMEEAVQSLRKALYLNRHLALAHFALGNISRSRLRKIETARHFANTLRLLRAFPPGQILPDSGGLTAGRLTDIVTALVEMEDLP